MKESVETKFGQCELQTMSTGAIEMILGMNTKEKQEVGSQEKSLKMKQRGKNEAKFL